jgi:hypothetical protein
VRRLWITALIDLALCVFYELIATLREPVGFADLWSGLVHGPSQILTFALPLVSPRELMVAPVALCWLTGALIGECIARGWHSVLPYVAMLVTFGLAYGGTARAITSADDGRRYDTLLAGALLLTLLLLRAAQAWVVQDESAEMTQPDGVLPLRGLAIGAVLSLLITAGAAGLVQTSVFTGRPATPARVPPLDQSHPLTPVSFVNGLRPVNPKSDGEPLFRVTTDRASSRYFALATVNFYDGDGWSFDRTFRPSGGVIPADSDPTMRPKTPLVTQTYMIDEGALTTVPWMPYLERAQRVTGTSVNIDPDSGMIVPAHELDPGEQYTVRSRVPGRTFDQIGPTAAIGTSVLTNDTTLDSDVSAPLGTLITALSEETGASSSQPVAFLQAVAADFRAHSALAGGSAANSASNPPSSSPSSSPSPGSPSPSPSASGSAHTGGTAFADVLASIRSTHAATPEQYATLTALIARKLGVPARVVAGFRVGGSSGALKPGSYDVTTAEAWTWVEIPIRGQGWVVLDPSPSTYSGQQPKPSSGTTPSATPSSTPAQTAQLTNGNNGNAAAKPSRVPHEKSVQPVSVVALVAIIAGAAVIAVLAVLLARKWVRVHRRRRIGDPRRRLLGAWHESLDFLVEAGLPEVRSMTSTEVAAATAERFGGDPAAQVRFIGNAANVAIFSPTSWVGPDQADAAWRAEAELARSVRRRLDWRRRLGTRLRYHRNRRITVPVGPTSWAAAARARAAAPRGGKHAQRGRRRAGRR